MKHKTAELTGGLLDAAVAKAEGLRWQFREIPDIGQMCFADWVMGAPGCTVSRYAPSSDESAGGPIIDRERISVMTGVVAHDRSPWFAAKDYAHGACGSGDTRLEAAMRCHVGSKLGDEVDL